MCLFMVTSTNFSLDKFYFLIWVKDSQSDAWTIARASPGNHLKHTLSGPSPDLLNQELGLRPGNLCFRDTPADCDVR